MQTPAMFKETYPNIAELLGDLPKKHVLMLMHPLERCGAFLRYIDELFKSCIAAMNALNLSKEKRDQIRKKLLDSQNFYSILPEVEVLVHLWQQGLSPIPEPAFPQPGPDFQVARDGLSACVEVCSLAGEKSERNFSLVLEYIHEKMKKVPSRYLIAFHFRSKVQAYSPFLKYACNTARRFLSQIESARIRKAVIYIPQTGPPIESLSEDDNEPRELDIEGDVSGYPIRVSYSLAALEQPGNYVMATGGGTWLGTSDKIRTALADKLGQLAKSETNIVVVDWSCLPGGGEYDFMDALYGTTTLVYTIGGNFVRQHRKSDGFFRDTTRVHAVIAFNRNVMGEPKPRWTIFPTNNLNAGKRLTLQELRMFGNIDADLEHLLT